MKLYFLALVLGSITFDAYAQSTAGLDTTLPVQFCLIGGKVITTEPNGKKQLVVAPPGTLKIVNLGKNINSPGIDFAPCVSIDGKTLYFVSDRLGSRLQEKKQPSEDIWAVSLLNSKPEYRAEPYNIDTSYQYGNFGLNTALNEGTLSISADQKTVYFTGCDRIDGIGSCDIYSCIVDENGKWGKPRNLGTNINTYGWESTPSISPDGKRLYFSSNYLSSQAKRHNDSLNTIINKKTLSYLIQYLTALPSSEKDKMSDFIDILIDINASDSIQIRSVTNILPVEFPEPYKNLLPEQLQTLTENLSTLDSNSILIALKKQFLEASEVDIFYSDLDTITGVWKQAVPLHAINTSKEEQSPFICADGKTLLFASEGYDDNLGKSDFYVTRMNDDSTWMTPVNLGAPINTPNDERFISMPANSEVVYFSSKRGDIENFQGDNDLFMAYAPLECSITHQSETDILEILPDIKSTPNSDLGALKEQSNLKKEISLKFLTQQNSVEALVEIAEPAFISLKVYNLVGQEIRVIIEKQFEQPGVYHFPLNISTLPSGAYFYRLEAGGQVITQGFAISR